MSDWKKLATNIFRTGTNIVTDIKNMFEQNEKIKQPLVTERDILKAIDELPDEPTQEVESAEHSLPTDYNMVKVPVTGTWASLEYVHKPDMHGLESIRIDEREYFTIPVGWSYDDNMEIQYWYMTFPLNGTDDDIIEFYSQFKIDEINFPGVE